MDRRKLVCYNPAGVDSGFVDTLRSNGWEIYPATQAGEAKNLIEKQGVRAGLVLFGQGESELAPIQELLAVAQGTEWVALLPAETGQNREVSRLLARGFFGFQTLPVDVARLQLTLGAALGVAQVTEQLRGQVGGFGDDGIIGCGPEISKVYAEIGKSAASDLPILIRGESGSGKELIARAIHRRSARADKPFVFVNCGALASELMQSEFLGYEQGAFRGADRTKPGSIESAAGGTLFLDDVAELPIELQAVMARFLQDKTIRRVGGADDIKVDVRVIAATRVDLEKAVASRLFRDDLHRSLNLFKVKVPPLREHKEDIERLAKYFLGLYVGEKFRHISGFAPETLAAMQQYDWPGNVRELNNRIRRAIVMCEGQWITAGDLGIPEIKASGPTFLTETMTLEQAKSEAEKEIIRLTLIATDNNISRAARHLDVSRMTLYRLMHKHRLRTPNSELQKEAAEGRHK